LKIISTAYTLLFCDGIALTFQVCTTINKIKPLLYDLMYLDEMQASKISEHLQRKLITCAN